MAPGKGTRQRQQHQEQQQQQQQQQQQEQRASAELQASTSDTSRGGAGEDEKEGARKAGGNTAPLLYSMENLQANMKAVNYGRSFMSIVAGVVAGVLGLTGLAGLLCYAAVMLLCSLSFLLKTGFRSTTYFDSANRVTFDGFFGGALSFVLFWTLAYDIVHIF